MNGCKTCRYKQADGNCPRVAKPVRNNHHCREWTQQSEWSKAHQGGKHNGPLNKKQIAKLMRDAI